MRWTRKYRYYFGLLIELVVQTHDCDAVVTSVGDPSTPPNNGIPPSSSSSNQLLLS
jgi:hypothetical protein